MTLIYFILILGITVFVHEFGHFICAKKSGIYVYEFSIGMGPKIFGFKRKNDETEYSIRLLPIGGYVQMAGEEIEKDENIEENKRFQSKTFFQKAITVTAGVIMNFILAIVLYYIVGFTNGVPAESLYVHEIKDNNIIQVGDKVLKYNGEDINIVDVANIKMTMLMLEGEDITFTVEHKDKTISDVTITPKKVEKDDEITYDYGISFNLVETNNIWKKIFYGFVKTFTVLLQMLITLWSLITGGIGLGAMSGPVGIYSVVGEVSALGIIALVDLLALICVNVGVINILPIPAFDGGRLLFLVIEKVTGRPINPKVENIIHTIFFFLLLSLIVVITFSDLGKMFNW